MKTLSFHLKLLLLTLFVIHAIPIVEANETGKGGWPPLVNDEQAALRWLEHVTGPLPDEEERKWWNVGSRQFGLSSTRYHIAFAGYAAAALGMRGDEAQKARAGRILDNCIGRYLRREVWAYSQAKNYWGDKPWAPDPCYRENVMYTGHLLQLLALYERFTGNTKYWTKGFEFKWKDAKSVHYDVQKLIDVTVEQMRENSTGGVTCEPGLLFFPCNSYCTKFSCKMVACKVTMRPPIPSHINYTRIPVPLYGLGDMLQAALCAVSGKRRKKRVFGQTKAPAFSGRRWEK